MSSKAAEQKPPHELKADKDTKPTAASVNAGGCGTGRKMPVLATDKYAECDIPDLPMWDPLDEEMGLKHDSTVVLVGKRRTGKSCIARHLMYLLKDVFSAGIVISQTDHLNHFWQEFVPKKYIYSKYDASILNAVFQRQLKILNSPNMTKAEKDKESKFFIVLDDVISDPAFQRNEPAIKELFVAGRHYRLFLILTTQYAKAVTPTLRGNTDFCIIMKTIQARQREALHEDFMDFLSREASNKIIEAYTEDNECLVVNTNPHLEMTPESILSWWKADVPPELPSFKLGSKAYWESSMREDAHIGSEQHPRSATELLTVQELMPTWAKSMLKSS